MAINTGQILQFGKGIKMLNKYILPRESQMGGLYDKCSKEDLLALREINERG